jgi:DNA-binding CsgD family transcriptional regulator
VSPHGPTESELGEIRRTLPLLRRGTGLPLAFGGEVGPSVGGVRSLRISELLGTTTDALRGLQVRSGSGLGGKAIQLAHPVWVGDYASAVTISHDYDGPVTAEGIRTILAVPVIVGREVRAVLYGAVHAALPLGDRPLIAAVTAARELEQRLAVRDAARATLAESQVGADDQALMTAARLEELRELHAELRGLADRIEDTALRDELLGACARLAATADPGHRPTGPRPTLSPRELDVLARVGLGATNAVIAQQLGLLPETVKSYLRSAMRKLGTHTRLEAVAAARRAGLLP